MDLNHSPTLLRIVCQHHFQCCRTVRYLDEPNLLKLSTNLDILDSFLDLIFIKNVFTNTFENMRRHPYDDLSLDSSP